MQNKLIFLDTETTGRGPEDRMIQVAFKSENYPEGKNWLIKPPVPITYEAMAVHHITNEMVADKALWQDYPVWQEILKKEIDVCVLIAHNAPFDIEMLKRDDVEVKRFIDTLKVAQHLWDEPSYKLQYLRYKLGLKIEGKAHDAEGDVAVLEALFSRLLEAMASVMEDAEPDSIVEKMMEISGLPTLLRHMPFGKHRGLRFEDVPKDYLLWLLKQEDIDGDLRFTCEQAVGKNLDERLTTKQPTLI